MASVARGVALPGVSVGPNAALDSLLSELGEMDLLADVGPKGKSNKGPGKKGKSGI